MTTLIVLESSWQWARLWWYGDNGWLALIDRVREQLDDATVDRQFGSEAFRRRDDLIARGIEHGEYDPLGVPLIGRTVTDELRASGWRIDDARNHRWTAERGADSVRVALVHGRLQVEVQWGSESVHGQSLHLGALERAILATAIDGAPPAAAMEGAIKRPGR